MYRKSLVLFLILSILVVSAIVLAQEPTVEPIPLSHSPPQMVTVANIEERPSQSIQIPLEPVAVDASNECESATVLTVPGGGSQATNSFDIGVNDPQINQCMWGSSPSTRGYRTAWFQFTAPFNGKAIIDTFGSNYDTVLAIHEDENPTTPEACTELRLLACNDDHNGFNARVEFLAQKDTTYYIEVADWQSGVSGSADLILSLEMDDITSVWDPFGSMSFPRTRHATVIVNNHIYTLGGQENVLGNPVITPRLDRYNAGSNSWTSLGQMPGSGISNSTAVYVGATAGDGKCADGCIYAPGGYDGGDQYNGDHWAYDIDTGEWISRQSIFNLTPLTLPFAWSTAVAHPDDTGYYLIGGLTTQPAITTTAQAHNNVFFYNVAGENWQTNAPNMITARYGHMATQLGNQICVVGGIGTGLVLLQTGECFTPNSGGWSTSIPALNYPRYGAGSSVGPDGKWYIFGGSDANHQAVPQVEFYDPNNAIAGWQVLPVSFDLGASEGILERAWARGGFVGNYLYAVGGNATQTTFPAISLIERLFVGSSIGYLPLIEKGSSGTNDTLETAFSINFNTPRFANFDTQIDFYDVFTFELASTDQVTIKLSQIPTGSDYNLLIYDDNKLLWGVGNNPGTLSENVQLTLGAGQYYVMVERVIPFGFPNSSNYRLIVER
ncbi:MAG: hypothetical protein AAF490_18800 [Chloroflexota bacterium]